MLHVWTDERQNIKLLSDDENYIITGFINNLSQDDPRNVTGHWLNDRWIMYEGEYTKDWRKHAAETRNSRLIAKNLKEKGSILALAFVTGRYKKAIAEYMKDYPKGLLSSDNEVKFARSGMKYYRIESDETVNIFLKHANKYGLNGFGFERIEEFVTDNEYGNEFLPSSGKIKFFGVEGLTNFKEKAYYTPLCMSFYTWNSYYNTGYMLIDYMPEYLNTYAWRGLFRRTIMQFFKQYPDEGILFNPAEEWEKKYCMKQGFVPADLDPKYDMSEYILYLKDFKNVD
jgi:hypothetical protein